MIEHRQDEDGMVRQQLQATTTQPAQHSTWIHPVHVQTAVRMKNPQHQHVEIEQNNCNIVGIRLTSGFLICLSDPHEGTLAGIGSSLPLSSLVQAGARKLARSERPAPSLRCCRAHTMAGRRKNRDGITTSA